MDAPVFEDLSTDKLSLLLLSKHPELRTQCLLFRPCTDDREELNASGGDWKLSVYRAVNAVGAHACVYKGRVRALFGFNPSDLPGTLVPWLISDGLIQKEVPVEFQRTCRKILLRAKASGFPLVNYAQEHCLRYDWLEYLGFTFDSVRTWCRGVPFRKFQWTPEE